MQVENLKGKTIKSVEAVTRRRTQASFPGDVHNRTAILKMTFTDGTEISIQPGSENTKEAGEVEYLIIG